MNSQQMARPLLTSRIVWAALTFSLFFYGFVLFEIDKIEFIKIPESYAAIEVVALSMGLMLFLTLWIHETKVKAQSNMTKRFPLYVICWALNETMVVLAFAAIVITDNGNGLLYLMNFILAISGNLIMFPKEAPRRP